MRKGFTRHLQASTGIIAALAADSARDEADEVSKMAEAVMEKVEIPDQEAQAIEDEIAEDEWESDWGAVFWCCFLLVIVLCGLGIAAWQPWVV